MKDGRVLDEGGGRGWGGTVDPDLLGHTTYLNCRHFKDGSTGKVKVDSHRDYFSLELFGLTKPINLMSSTEVESFD